MFDDLEDEEIDLLPEEQSVEKDEKISGKPNISELLSTAIKTDMGTAIRRHSQLELKRQYSMPLSRQKSARSQLSAAFSAPPTIEEHEPRSVKIRELPEDEDPQPGTSKDEDISELTEPKDTLGQKVLNFLLFIWAFIESAMISLTNFLNIYSRDYRYVLKVLAKEKKILKEKTNYNIGLRLGSSQVWQPAGSYHSLLKQSIEGSPVLSVSTAGIFSPSDSYRISMIAERMASMQNSESEEKPPISEDSDTKALATPLPYSSEQESKLNKDNNEKDAHIQLRRRTQNHENEVFDAET
ncbi:hypothetical protein NQ314_021304 [Rhamnusium bicolor]|uniref:Uncharacterized protein n=1 Tax=Rhamnusium bicolor TaxID=1586634 RepID=A0AAV8WIG1_9CUCU|nr:hypothetical protein NQ314_021304 [Rhamnusium bicolor]